MKEKLFALVLIAFTAILIQACKKDTGPYPMSLEERIKNSSGTVTAMLNGKPWVSTLTNADYWQGSVGIVAEYHFDKYQREELSLSNINQLLPHNSIRYRNPVTYEYGNPDGIHAFFSIAEDDADLATYYVIPDTMANNYVEITNYNDATHEIKGKFQISFYRVYTIENNVYDTVRFTNGAFSLTIK